MAHTTAPTTPTTPTAPTAPTVAGAVPAAPANASRAVPLGARGGRGVRTAVPVLGAPLRTLRRSLPLGQALLLAALPYGGQRVARRNAWSGMSPEAGLARGRSEVEQALAGARAQEGGRQRRRN